MVLKVSLKKKYPASFGLKVTWKKSCHIIFSPPPPLYEYCCTHLDVKRVCHTQRLCTHGLTNKVLYIYWSIYIKQCVCGPTGLLCFFWKHTISQQILNTWCPRCPCSLWHFWQYSISCFVRSHNVIKEQRWRILKATPHRLQNPNGPQGAPKWPTYKQQKILRYCNIVGL